MLCIFGGASFMCEIFERDASLRVVGRVASERDSFGAQLCVFVLHNEIARGR